MLTLQATKSLWSHGTKLHIYISGVWIATAAFTNSLCV